VRSSVCGLALATAIVLVLIVAAWASAGTKVISVPAVRPFLNTGVVLAPSDSATITATGSISPDHQRPPLPAPGRQRPRPAVAGRRPIYLGDELLTTPDGRVALEFVIGGRVSVRPGASVTVTGERSVNGGSAEDTGLDFLGTGGATSPVHVESGPTAAFSADSRADRVRPQRVIPATPMP